MAKDQRPATATARRRRRAAGSVVLGSPLLAAAAALAPTAWRGWSVGALAAAAGLLVIALGPGEGRAAPPWRLIGVGLLTWGVGILVGAADFGAVIDDPPAPADVPRFAGLLVLAGGVVAMASARLAQVDWIGRVDALLVGVGAGGAVVALLSGPMGAEPRPLAAVVMSWAALGAGVLGASAAVRVALTGVRHLPAGRFLVAATFLLIVGAGLLRLDGFGLVDADLDGLGALFAVAGSLGLLAAAIHPSANRVAEKQHRPAHALPHLHLAVLVLACVATPVTAGARHLAGAEVEVVHTAPVGLIVAILLIVRLQLVVRSGQRQARQAETLRQVALAVGSARTVGDLRRATMDGAVALADGQVRYVAWLTGNERGTVCPVEVIGAERPLRREDTELDAVLAHVQDLGDHPFELVDAEGRPIVVTPIPTRMGGITALAIAPLGRPAPLAEGLAVLATQAALALDALVQQQELEQRRSEARLQQLARHASDAVVVVDAVGTIRYQTPSVVRVLGYLAVDLDGESVDRIVHPDDAGHLRHFLDALLASSHESVRTIEVQVLRADDSIIVAEVIGVNLLDNPDVRGLVLTMRDVTGRRTLQDQLRHQAFHDSLTGLANRALFADRVEHALQRVRRTEQVTPAVLFIDLDDFKMVNDSLGHDAGDQLLIVLADRLRGVLRSGDTAARLGGDEFAILIEDAPDVDAVREVAERVLDAVSEPMTIEGRLLHLRASVGVATRQAADMSPGDLLRNADLAMYAAKAKGKGCVEVFEPAMHLRAVDLLTVRADLEADVAAGRIEVEYQPVLRLSDREVVGFEALARWRHPERGLVGPSEFLAVAEDTGVVVALGRIVLREALQQLARWRRAGGDPTWTMSVNLSPRESLAADLVEAVQRALADAGLPPSSLMIELTEPSLLADTDAVLQRIHHLKDLGVKVAVDNFGTGYSSLGYLQRVPLDVVKIDRSLVSPLRTQQPKVTVTRTIVDLVRTLGRDVVAQGVEVQSELDGLLELGCSVGQGFLLHRPAPAEQLSAELGLVEVG